MTDRRRGPAQRRRQPDRLRPHAAQGGRPLPARQGQLRRRRATCPGMLHGAVLRSPYAHARIVSIDTVGGRGPPEGARPSSPAPSWRRSKLAWMPTLSHDVQAVLATDKVRFQGQEVAFVVAEDRYSARDALELIDVEYEPLPPVIDARSALDPDAPVIRDDIEGKTDNHIFDWESGDKAALRRGVRRRRRRRRRRTCSTPASTRRRWRRAASVADMDQVTGKLTVWSHDPGAARPPHRLRAGGRPPRAQDPDHLARHRRRLRQQGRHLPRLRAASVVGSIVTGKPVKWMEDRSENLMSTSFARDYHMHGEIAATSDGKILGLRVDVLADHGAFNGTAQPTKFPAGFFHIFTGSLRPTRRPTARSRASTPTRRPAASPTPARSGSPRPSYLVERMVDCLADELAMDPAELRMKNLLRPEQFPYTTPDRAGSTTRATTRARCSWPCDIAGYDELRPSEQAREAGRRRADGHRPRLLHRGRRRRAAQAHGHPRPRHGRRLRAARPPDRQGRSCGCRVQTQGQGHETTFAQIVAQELGIPPEDIEVDPRRHRQHAVRPRHLRLALDAGVRCGGGGRRPTGAGQGQASSPPPRSSARPTTSSGSTAAGT